MNRLVAIVGGGVLAVGLLGWSVPAWGQSGTDKAAPRMTPKPLPSLQMESGAWTPRPAPPQPASTGGAAPMFVSDWNLPVSPPKSGVSPRKSPPASNAVDANVNRRLEAARTPENDGSRQEPAISLEWTGPSTAKIGQISTYSLIVRNTCNISVQDVMVRVRVPEGVGCPETAPKAVAEGDVLIWQLGDLSSRQEKNLKMKLMPNKKGDVVPQAWVTFTGTARIRVKVSEPKLVVQAKGPKAVLVGETATFILTVSNPGDGAAEHVKIHALLSEGLENARGPKLDYDIGDLAGGETRTITVQCLSQKGGEQKCEVVAEAGGGLHCGVNADVTVNVPRLKLDVVGPALRYLGRKALYTFTLTNPGNAPARNVTLRDVVPQGFKILAASDGGRHDATTRTVSWFLGEVQAGQKHEVQLQVQAVGPGELQHKASAVAAHGLTAESQFTTRVEGLSALLLEMVDTEDPIEVNSETAYEVRIANTGSKVETDIKLLAVIPDKMEFKKATGPAPYHVEGKTVVFEPLPQLAPKADAVFRIYVHSLDAGIVRFKIQMTSTHLTEPVIKMEATRIYSDAPDGK